jgi:uncharacterized protein (TIGR03067 family)
MRRLLAALIIVMTTGVAAPVLGQDKALEGDLKKLQGKWSTKGPDGSPIVLMFEKDKVSIKLIAPSGDEMTLAGDFTIDENVKPRAMTWTNVKVRTKDMPNMTAIYELSDDETLKIAGVGGSTRPKEFIEKGKELPGIRPNTMTLTRAKDEPKK